MAAFTTIDDPEAYFQVALYTGNGSTQSITLPGDTDMQPDLVWTKGRNQTRYHVVTDSVRGTNSQIYPNSSEDENTYTNSVTAFDSDGFSVGSENDSNGNTNTFVAWCWKESATSGFDIVSFTGSGSARTISHSLSAVPAVMIIKNRSANLMSFRVYHHKNTSAPETDYLNLDFTDATADDATTWNDTAPTSSVFSVGTSDQTNKNTDSLITYLWSEKQGFSKFGTYEGNGNADGTFVYTGFRPAWVMIKRTDSTDGWLIVDNKRAGYNGGNNVLEADVSSAEDTGVADRVDILSNGFKLRNSWSKINTSGGTYIYMAFAEAPFVNSNGVPCNAR